MIEAIIEKLKKTYVTNKYGEWVKCKNKKGKEKERLIIRNPVEVTNLYDRKIFENLDYIECSFELKEEIGTLYCDTEKSCNLCKQHKKYHSSFKTEKI